MRGGTKKRAAMTSPFEAGRNDGVQSRCFQSDGLFWRGCCTDCPDSVSAAFIQYFRGWDSINEAEHCWASVDGCTDLCSEILRLGFDLRRRFNAEFGIVSRKCTKFSLDNIRTNVRSLAIGSGDP